jgi:hypothetical protein
MGMRGVEGNAVMTYTLSSGGGRPSRHVQQRRHAATSLARRRAAVYAIRRIPPRDASRPWSVAATAGVRMGDARRVEGVRVFSPSFPRARRATP